MTLPIAIGLGSNVGDSRAHLAAAARAIASWPEVSGFRCSSLYVGPYVGPLAPQDDYSNAACRFACTLAPREILRRAKALEARAGRGADGHERPRPLDLDLLVAGGLCVDEDRLRIPHPRMLERRFVVEPLAEIWPELVVPGSTQRLDQRLQSAEIQAQLLRIVVRGASWALAPVEATR